MVRDEHWITVQEAARRLGVKDDAIRKRIQRGTLRSEKAPEDGRVYVYLDTAQDAAYAGTQDTTYDAAEDTVVLVEEMRDRIAYLERMLDQESAARTEERRRHDTLMATLMQRLPELAPPRASPEPHGPETVAEEPEGVDVPPGQVDRETGVQGRSWWRRFFGFE